MEACSRSIVLAEEFKLENSGKSIMVLYCECYSITCVVVLQTFMLVPGSPIRNGTLFFITGEGGRR